MPPRTAETIWEIGVPDRDSHEFLNGDSLYGYWATSYVNYPTEFPRGVTYTVGTDKYAKTWNYAMMNANTWKVDFTLPKAPTTGTPVHHAMALKSDFLVGDGIHELVVMGLNGRIYAHSQAGQSLDLSRLARGAYFARCGAKVLAIPLTR
jgi:hypothetical protein